jgi:hypothetical protein
MWARVIVDAPLFVYPYTDMFALHMPAFVTSRGLLCEGFVKAGGALDGWVSHSQLPEEQLLAPLSFAGWEPGALA